jgi:ZIP family zinc transporter
MLEVIFFSFLTFASTLVGGFVALKNNNRIHYIMSFTAGVLIAVCFFDIMPEIFEITRETDIDPTIALAAVVVGFLAIHLLEKLAIIHSNHETEYASHRHPTVGLIGAAGLAFHSFLDGIGIGLGFHVSTSVGFVVSLAVLAHDFSDGLNTVTLMLTNKNSRKKTIILLLIDSTTPILGAVSTFLFQIPNSILQVYLGFFVGFLLYIAASDLLPEAHSEHSSYKMLLLTCAGVLFIFMVTRFV